MDPFIQKKRQVARKNLKFTSDNGQELRNG
jgi:hypothetical protein